VWEGVAGGCLCARGLRLVRSERRGGLYGFLLHWVASRCRDSRVNRNFPLGTERPLTTCLRMHQVVKPLSIMSLLASWRQKPVKPSNAPPNIPLPVIFFV
jgi:hypothetical protein